MSAIAGILNFNGSMVDPAHIHALTRAMSARGPDGQAQWMGGPVALGHCQLRATPESRYERQPLTSADGRHVLVWDGRLDNRPALQRELVSLGHALRDNSDAEIVLHSYLAWGQECPLRLLGDFAFAVWDSGRNELFLARDRMAAKPLYYARDQSRFAFASEEEALLALPWVSPRPNEDLIAYSLVPEFTNFNRTRSWLRDVSAFNHAEAASLSAQGDLRIWKYWNLQPGNELRFTSDDECREAFLEVFGEAVRRRMRAEGDIGLMLSGGLDSAGILAMTKRLLPKAPGKALHTYSAVSDDADSCIETKCIRSMTAGMGENAHTVRVPSFTGMVSVKDLIEVAWSRPHPVDNDILLLQHMCLAASRDGHRVILNGMAGDLTMRAPNHYPAWLMRAGRWRAAWRECRTAGDHSNYHRGRSFADLFLSNLWTAYVPEKIRRLRRDWRAERPERALERSVIRREFADRMRLAERLREQHMKPLGTIRTQDMQQWHADHVLFGIHGIPSGLTGYGRAGGRFGVEMRDPWADVEVVEFFHRLPLHFKVRDGWAKFLVRSTFTPDLDASVRWRLGKEHLGWQFIKCLMEECSDLAAQVMEDELQIVEEYIDLAAVRRRYRAYRATKTLADIQGVYEMMVLVKWLQRMLRLSTQR